VPPNLSIITPVYQGRQFISGCIESVIHQKHDSIEHIIVDGGSTDGTVEIVRAYLQKYPHIRFMSEKDSGQSNALNKGIRLAHGGIIGILNGDDFYEPDVLKHINGYFAALKEPALVVGNCYVRGINDQISYVSKPKRLRQIDLLLGLRLNPLPMNPSAYFYHKSLHEKVGFYDETDHYTMDLNFILKAVTVAQVLYVDQCWGNFRYIPGTKTYQDASNGENQKRVNFVLESFVNELPLFQRCWVRFLRYRKVGYFYYRIGYYLEHPVERIGKYLNAKRWKF